ncbi:MAG: Gfo/Idh/MocA family oxidoreductase [Armatimonadota bacterium]|nr:Gfo/Idh/MocA family oxidoreductase [Armatimonadota bacterium]
MSENKEIRCGIIGYGGAFNMGRHHANYMHATGRMRLTAVCDIDPARTAVAKQDFPEIETYNDVEEMLRKAPMDLAVIILPHNLHAPVAIQALNAGKHCVVEKPMCLSIQEADAMIAAARRNQKMLSVYHNRRWDGDHLAMLEVVQKGIIGDIFHVEAFMGGFNAPRDWWRARKEISGGAFFDWGAHFLYWLFGLVPELVESVTGFFHKRVWHQMTNEDQVQALIRFKSGAVADVQQSSIAYAGKARWRILGTKGAIVDEGGRGAFRVRVGHEGYIAEFEVKYKDSQHAEYYKNIAAHLLDGAPLEITPEKARRCIAVMDLAERSAKTGREQLFPEQP